MTLQEMLQKRAALIEQQKALVEAAKAMNRGLNPEESTKFDELNASIEGLDKLIEAEKRVASLTAALDEPAETVHRPQVVPGLPSQNNQKKDDGGFASIGEFVAAVRFGDSKGRLQALNEGPNGGRAVPDAFVDDIMPWRVNAEWQMGVGEDGGFAVPVQRRDTVMMLRPESGIMRTAANTIPAGAPPDAPISIPALQQGAKGVFGGVEVQWIGEGDEKPETQGNLREITWTPHEVAGHTVVTDKLLRNWAAAGTFIRNLLQGAVRNAEDLAFLVGDGVAKPLGVLNGGGVINVNRAKAGEVAFGDIADMLSKMLPEATPIWVASQSIMDQIIQLKDENGNSIFIRGDATQGIADRLFGRPIRWTGKVPSKGSRGDLMLVDRDYYLIKDGSGPFVAASEHVYFKNNKTVIKVFWNVDGKGWVDTPLTLEDGTTTVSPFVALDAPKE